MTALDRESFTARRVGPLDVYMLEEQQMWLESVLTGGTLEDEPHTRDAVSGAAHLIGHLVDCFGYAEQEAARAPHERARIAVGRVFDALAALSEIVYDDREPGEEGAELRWQLPDLHEILAAVAGATVHKVAAELPVSCFPELTACP